MSSITSSKLAQKTSKILCHYFNSTYKIQVIRIWNGNKYSLEKIISLGARTLAD